MSFNGNHSSFQNISTAILIQNLLTDFIQQSCLQNNKKQNNRISKKTANVDYISCL